MYDLGMILKELRIAKGYSQAQVAQKINKSKSVISRYESNQQMPTLDTLISLAFLYNVSLDHLAGIERKKSLLIESLTPEQENILNTLILEFRNKKPLPRSGLTSRQLHLINALLIEFSQYP